MSQITDVEDSQELDAGQWSMVTAESTPALAQGSEQSAGDRSGPVPPSPSAETLTPALAQGTITASSEAAAAAAFDGGLQDSGSGRSGMSEGMAQQLLRQELGSGCTLVKVWFAPMTSWQSVHFEIGPGATWDEVKHAVYAAKHRAGPYSAPIPHMHRVVTRADGEWLHFKQKVAPMEREEQMRDSAGSSGEAVRGAACPREPPVTPEIVSDDSVSGTGRKRRVTEVFWSKREQEVVLVPNSSFRKTVKEWWP